MKLFKILSNITICLFFSLYVLAQDGYKLNKDSLERLIPKQEGKEKLRSYEALAFYYFNEAVDDESLQRLVKLQDQLWIEAEKQNNKEAQGRVIITNADAYFNLSKRDEMIVYVQDNLEFLSKNELWDAYYSVSQAVLEAYLCDEKYETAIREAKKMYVQAKEREHRIGVMATLYTIGLAYFAQNRTDEAISYYEQCLEIPESEEQSYYFRNFAYRNLTEALLTQKRYDEAMVYLKKWETFIYELFKDWGGDPFTWCHIYQRYAELYIQMKDYDRAERYCNSIDSITGLNRVQVETDAIRAHIFELRGDYNKALDMADRALESYPDNSLRKSSILWIKSKAFAKLGKAEESYVYARRAFEMTDSIKDISINKQVDEIHSIYEVDKLSAEKERNRNYFFFALGGCLLLVVTLGIWVYYNRQITKKNKILVKQIRELQAQQDRNEKEILNKTTFVEDRSDDDLCPDSRKDKLCIAIRDIMLKEKIYRDPALNRELLIDRLGTNKEMFTEAFQQCLGVSFLEFVNRLRLKDAITLLEQSDLSIEEVSDRVGFGSVRTFQRQFLSKYNMSPKDYRKITIDA